MSVLQLFSRRVNENSVVVYAAQRIVLITYSDLLLRLLQTVAACVCYSMEMKMIFLLYSLLVLDVEGKRERENLQEEK